MARILIIEDNPTNMELMVYLLSAFGHTTQEAHDGEEGLKAARRDAFGLIICDIDIPRLNGYEVARRLKADPVLRAIPLVAVTALAMVGDRDRVLAAGFDGYIPKPIAPETFVGQIETFLGGPDHRPIPQPTSPEPARASEPSASRAARHAPRAVILAVDNMPENLHLLRSLLEPSGYEVVTAGGVSEALALLRQRSPDLILSDVHMPDQDGYDLIRTVKSDLQWSRIPFVFISSTVWQDKDRRDSLAFGANQFILRPIEPETLLKEIETILKKSDLTPQTPFPKGKGEQPDPPPSPRGRGGTQGGEV